MKNNITEKFNWSAILSNQECRIQEPIYPQPQPNEKMSTYFSKRSVAPIRNASSFVPETLAVRYTSDTYIDTTIHDHKLRRDTTYAPEYNQITPTVTAKDELFFISAPPVKFLNFTSHYTEYVNDFHHKEITRNELYTDMTLTPIPSHIVSEMWSKSGNHPITFDSSHHVDTTNHNKDLNDYDITNCIDSWNRAMVLVKE